MRLCIAGSAASEHVSRWVRHFVGRGHDVHVVSVSEGAVPGATYHRLGWGAGGFLRRAASYVKMAVSLRKVLEELGPDLVQAHFAYTYGALVARAGFHPSLLVTQGSDVILPTARDRAVRALAACAVRHADVVTGNCDFQVAAARALGAAGSVYRLPYGVDLERFAPRQRDGDGDGFRIGIFKRLEPLYRHRDLLDAFAAVVQAHPAARLAIVGDGRLRGRLEAQAVRLGIRNSVEFLGMVPHERVPDIMATLDAVVLTSLSEGLPNMVLEAFAASLPAVATAVGGVPELVLEGRTGLLVPARAPQALSDAILRLAADVAARLRMGQAARELVETEYDCRRNTQRMEQVALDLARAGGRTQPVVADAAPG